MRSLRVRIKALMAFAALCALVALGTTASDATGAISINRADGTSNNYNDVAVKIIHQALYLTSEDGKGTLVINRAACSYQGKLLVCFATHAVLVQGGETNVLDLKTGTIYLNTTDDAQPLVLSSTMVPAHGILLSLTTKRGTYVTLSGTIDSVIK